MEHPFGFSGYTFYCCARTNLPITMYQPTHITYTRLERMV
jgi:hypothetical protein